MSDDKKTLPYQQAVHAMQAGVAAMMGIDPKETEPKHLRVGINSAMADHAALAHLLIEKGLITEVEYAEAVAEFANREVKSYEAKLSEKLGRPVTLGSRPNPMEPG